MVRSVRRGFFINDHDLNWRVKTLLFVLWPFGTFIYSLRCLQSKSSRWIFFLICMAFGLCIECKDDAFDMSRITDVFYSYQNMDFRGLKDIYVDFYNGYGERDLYESVLSWSVNQISSNHHLFWMVASMIYAFFYLKSLSFILDDNRFRSCLTAFMIVFMFTMPEPIFSVTGLRFWTAGWIAICSTLNIILRNDRKFYLALLITPLIHLTYFIYVALIVFFLMLKDRRRMLIGLLYISYLFSFVSLHFVNRIIEMGVLPISLQEMAIFYTSSNSIYEFNATGTGWYWVSVLSDNILRLYYFVMINIVFIKGNIESKKDNYLICFVLIVYSFANLTWSVPHVGIRYINFVYILLPLCWFRIFGLSQYKWYIYFYPLCSVFYLMKERLYHYSCVLDVDFLYSSLFAMIYDSIK